MLIVSLRSESRLVSLMAQNFRFVLLLLRYINPLIFIEAGQPVSIDILVIKYYLLYLVLLIGGMIESYSGSWIWLGVYVFALVLLGDLKHWVKMSLITDNNFFLLWSMEVLLLRIRVIIHLMTILIWSLLQLFWWFLVLAFHVVHGIRSLSFKLLLQC